MKHNTLTNLAIIMDGNGRWAKAQNKPRSFGHERGADTIRAITEFCSNHATIQTLTLYAFSTENWKRPKLEVDFLMKLLKEYLENELATYHAFGVRFDTIGDLSRFSNSLQKQIELTKKETKNYANLTQILALNYGSQDEITRAINRLLKKHQPICSENITQALDTPFANIDLLIRTGGEKRLSNFLLWQCAYAELYFSDTLWPDFTPQELQNIIEQFGKKHRRFGGL